MTEKRVKKAQKNNGTERLSSSFHNSPSNIFYLAEARTAEALFIPLDDEPVLLCLKNMGCDKVKKDTWIKNVLVDTLLLFERFSYLMTGYLK